MHFLKTAKLVFCILLALNIARSFSLIIYTVPQPWLSLSSPSILLSCANSQTCLLHCVPYFTLSKIHLLQKILFMFRIRCVQQAVLLQNKQIGFTYFDHISLVQWFCTVFHRVPGSCSRGSSLRILVNRGQVSQKDSLCTF